MTIKEVFIVCEAVVSDQLQDVSMGLHSAQAAQAGVGVLSRDNRGMSELLYQLCQGQFRDTLNFSGTEHSSKYKMENKSFGLFYGLYFDPMNGKVR